MGCKWAWTVGDQFEFGDGVRFGGDGGREENERGCWWVGIMMRAVEIEDGEGFVRWSSAGESSFGAKDESVLLDY